MCTTTTTTIVGTFDTAEEAVDLNSDCTFCELPKFVTVAVRGGYLLERCTNEFCNEHCKWGHEPSIYGRPYSAVDLEDIMESVSGVETTHRGD